MHMLDDLLKVRYGRLTQSEVASGDDLVVFDEAAINDNYDGRLAAHQIQQLRSMMLGNMLWVISAFLFTAFLAVTARNSNNVIYSVAEFFVLLIICALICFPWLRRVYYLWHDIKGKIANKVDGPIWCSKKSQFVKARYAKAGIMTDYSIAINEFSFDVTEEIYLMCKKDGNYRVYYTPFTREFLNVHSL